MPAKPRRLYATDLRRQTAALAHKAEQLGDPLLHSLYLMALAHLEDRIRANRQRLNLKPAWRDDDPAIERAMAMLARAKAPRN